MSRSSELHTDTDSRPVGLKAETAFPNIHLRLLDLAKFSSVVDFADKLEKEEDRLDIVIANAAMAREHYSTTEDGWETG